MRSPAGTTLLILIALLWLGLEWSRPLLRCDEVPPAPRISASHNWVLLEDGFPEPGLHQFSDGQTLGSVTELTGLPVAASVQANPCYRMALSPGLALDIVVQHGEIIDILSSWMTAGQRLALHIPLQPDRMTAADWETLPGIGSNLARRIILDRQENGDFGSLDGLKRVKGIGNVRISSWKKFFPRPDLKHN